MSKNVSESAFEEAIERTLLTAPSGGWAPERPIGDEYGLYGVGWTPGGFRSRNSKDYNQSLCLVPQDVLDFVYATQPKTWGRLIEYHGSDVNDRFLTRLSREISRRGTLDVLRKGIKDSGCKFSLLYFQPASGLNPELQGLHQANLFTVIRQLHYSEKSQKSLDLVLFLNGLPLFAAELKNPLTGQNVQHAIDQYRFDRSPHEPLLANQRCLAHFAVDPNLVYVTTKLEGTGTHFLPFNQGKFGGAGNPPVPPTQPGYPTSYLWERIWARDSILDLIQHFIHRVGETNGTKSGSQTSRLIFPRYHQLDAVRRLVRHAREDGPGQRYLIQHSAGSGKSNSIAWLAHQLSVLHDTTDQRIFDSIIVITDRRVLDRQLQRTVRQFEQMPGVVENIEKTSRQLQEALERGKTIIVTTLQKFPVISDQIRDLPAKRFAVIIDEAHSSQTGESTKSLKAVLSAQSLEQAESSEADEGEDEQDRVVAELKKRRFPSNVSFFAFTATPKPKTLELFGTKKPDGRHEAFSLYTMRQAIEEKFIVDVLEHYTTYKTYWQLLKTVADDPRYDRRKANYLLRSFVDLHPHAISKKIEIMVEHFHNHIAHRIGKKAKAMIVTRSRLHAVRYQLALNHYLGQRRYPYRSLVAFSGTVHDEGVDFTEAGMNGFSETQTAAAFGQPEYRFLVVAEKFQTGFDQPLLHTMYVDRKLSGVHAVQTLSRLNRIHPEKHDTVVLDFANTADEIRKAFEPYYEKTLLSEGTDPNRLHDLEQQIRDFHVIAQDDLDRFARAYFRPHPSQAELYSVLDRTVARFNELETEECEDFRGALKNYVRLYSFLSQVVAFIDPDLEKLYVFARYLRRRLPVSPEELPREILQNVNMESYRIHQTSKDVKITPERGIPEVSPINPEGGHGALTEDLEPLSQIITELNERFGTDFSEEDKVFVRQLEEQLQQNQALNASVNVNTPENARLTFDYVVNERLQDMVETNFKFYKRINDDPQFAKYFLDWLFDRFRKESE